MKTKMSAEAREAKLAYMKKWRDKNPDKVKEAQIRYWERQAAKSQSEVNRATLLHKEGHSLREIAEELGVSHMSVRRMLQNDRG